MLITAGKSNNWRILESRLEKQEKTISRNTLLHICFIKLYLPVGQRAGELETKNYADLSLTIRSYINMSISMTICHQCKKEIKLEKFVGRQEQCLYCRADLHCCLNCTYYDSGVYNNCRETQAERVLDKSHSNFCDFFCFREEGRKTNERKTDAQNMLAAIFKSV